MGEKMLVKRDYARITRLILIGPVGNWIYDRLSKTDYERQVEAVQKMREEGMEHGHVKMSSKHRGKIFTKYGDASLGQQHDGEYTW